MPTSSAMQMRLDEAYRRKKELDEVGLVEFGWDEMRILPLFLTLMPTAEVFQLTRHEDKVRVVRPPF